MEIVKPGGIYGRIKIDQLGKVQPDTRNPVLAAALETLGLTENRYSGIPTIRREMQKYGLIDPVFKDERGSFIVCFYKESNRKPIFNLTEDEENILTFCATPRTRKEICDYLGMSSITYTMQKHVQPLIDKGLILLSIPEKPKSPRQLYYAER